MKITLDTAEPLSLKDGKILQMLLDDADLSVFKTVEEGTVRSASLDEKVGPHGGTVEKVEPEPEPEPETEASVSKDLAIQRGVALVSEGKTDLVKAALEKAGAKRVSELTDDAVPIFLEALDA